MKICPDPSPVLGCVLHSEPSVQLHQTARLNTAKEKQKLEQLHNEIQFNSKPGKLFLKQGANC